jgi:Putative prokaryotic signal transducing protein
MSRLCPRCGAEFEDTAQVCWTCRAHLVPEERTRGHLSHPDEAEHELEHEHEPPAGEPEWVDWKSVYDAPDEFSALAVQALLSGSGIEAQVRSGQIPWVDGIMRNILGYWGRVLVEPDDYVRAKELLADYLRSLEQQAASRDPEDGEDETESAGDSGTGSLS